MLKPFLSPIFFVVLLFSTTIGIAQKKTNPDVQSIINKFPDDKCLAIDEKVNYTFTLNQKGKTNSFVINENYSAHFITPEDDYSKINSVFYDDQSEISSLKYLVNKTVVKNFPVMHSNYESAGIFHDDLKICAYKMDMAKGNTYEVDYVKAYHDPRLFSKIYFHENYPVHKKTISFEVPDWVDLELKPVNFEGFTISKNETALTSGGAKKGKRITYEMENIDAIPRESHSPSSAKYLPHILVFVKAYHDKKHSENYFATHANIYKWCRTLLDSVNNEAESLQPIVKEIIKNETDSFKIMENIFYWVQEHVRYIAFEDGIMGYKPMPAKKVCNMLYGDCKGMANLTKNLLKLAGIDARLTWIGTSDIPYNNDLPILAVYNHMICTAFLGGKKYFLDATEDYIAVNDYAERIQGRPVMIENGTSYLTDKIPYFGYERNKQEDIVEFRLDGNTIKGKATLTCYGEQKTVFLRNISGLKTENKDLSIKNYLKSANPNLNITGFTTSNLNERSKPLAIHYTFEQSNSAYTTSGKELLILPEKDNDFAHLDFDSTRKNDYEFNNRYFITTTTTINVPANYTVKKLPGAVEVKNDDYEFNLKYENSQGTLKLVKEIKIKNILLKKSQFKQWNADVKLLRDFYHSPIILKTN